MKHVVYFLLMVGIGSASLLQAQNTKTIVDLHTNAKFSYTEKYIELKNSPFNFFDELGVQYPVIDGNEKVNRLLYHQLVNYLQTDSFKLEFLQKANLAARLNMHRDLNRYDYGVNTVNNYENFLPLIKDADYRLSFLYDNLLSVQLSYRYDLGEALGDDFRLEKQFFISVRDGKLYTLEQLLATDKRAAFRNLVGKKLKESLAEAKQVEEEEPVQAEEGTYEEEGDDLREEAKTEVVINELQLEINPFSSYVNVADLSVNSLLSRGRGLQLRFSIQELKPYIHLSGPLRNLVLYSKLYTTPLRGFNPEQTLMASSWQSQFNMPFRASFLNRAPAPGIKTVARRVSYGKQTEGALQSIITFDRDGKPLREDMYDSGREKPTYSHVYEYNTQGLLAKITSYSYDKLSETSSYIYDSFGNLVKRTKTEKNGRRDLSNYYYDGYIVYEEMMNDEQQDNHLRAYHLNSYGKLYCIVDVGSECYGTLLFDKDKPMASFNPQHPTLDNVIYAYDTNGKLLTVQRDNGRHLHEMIYDKQEVLQKVVYTESGTVKDMWEYWYNGQGLLEKERVRNGIYDYDYSRSNNQYIYTFEYAYY